MWTSGSNFRGLGVGAGLSRVHSLLVNLKHWVQGGNRAVSQGSAILVTQSFLEQSFAALGGLAPYLGRVAGSVIAGRGML